MTKLSERAKILEAAGIDTSKFNMETNGIVLTLNDKELTSQIIEDRQVNNKAFRRWITAQTFKMLYGTSYNNNINKLETGWDACLRNNYSYMYQFEMLLEELKILNKLEVKDKQEFKERSKFFTKEVVIELCGDYMYRLNKYCKRNVDKRGYVKLSKYGNVQITSMGELFTNRLRNIIKEIEDIENYAELYTLFKQFIKHMNKLPKDTTKCALWKDAFKGSGAYYTLKNLILFHNVLLRDCSTKEESLQTLNAMLDECGNGDLWRLHMCLKDAIEYNNFDLRKSLNK